MTVQVLEPVSETLRLRQLLPWDPADSVAVQQPPEPLLMLIDVVRTAVAGDLAQQQATSAGGVSPGLATSVVDDFGELRKTLDRLE